MKHMISNGEGLDKPFEENEVLINFKLYVNEKVILEKENINNILNKDSFNEAEIIMIKSMKKLEKSKIEIYNKYFLSMKDQTGLIDKDTYETIDPSSRIAYEIELLKINSNISKFIKKDISIRKQVLNKGVGNICPWRNALVMIAFDIKVNGKTVYTDFDNNGLKNDNDNEDFVKRIKQVKQNVKNYPNFEKGVQFIVEEQIKNNHIKSYQIYDLYTHYLPDVINEMIPTMKILEIVNLKFTGALDYFKILNTDIELYGNESNEYDITFCLVNFQENYALFNNSAFTPQQQYEKVMVYKKIANDYYSKNLLKRAKRINKYLVDEYIKYINLKDKNQLTHNKEHIIQKVNIQDTDLELNIMTELKRIHSNLIMILFKQGKNKKCDDYINQYFITQNQEDEKVLFYKYKILLQLTHYEEAKIFLEKLINNTGKQEYSIELQKLNSTIFANKKNKDIFVKKMFKFN